MERFEREKEERMALLRGLAPRRQDFALGMAAAFCECVAGEAKPLAFSPPLSPEEAGALQGAMEAVAALSSLGCFLEENRELSEESRLCWFVFYKFPEDLAAYRALRMAGKSPLRELKDFWALLGYGQAGPGGERRLREERPAADLFGELF